ncbi:hypothetical protein BDN72DRAFT_566387 [Pluteus cervinus]|uniref:Uncharacterized protein n=1 Tax=Pluteus cervinus TaxID=181527 RepID=A0ACD3AWM6_9AGAR|nr:hypothetical protein BDN72DRAFT_566387 [Pluteus cervinus]
MASGNPLPLELVEIVLEYFFGLYPTINPPDTTLFNCSLVCRSWHPIAQSIRFSELVLPYSYGRWPPIVSALKRNPTLFQYVRSVLITNVRSLEVAEILSLLPNLRRVSIVHRMLSRKVAGGRADELMNVAMNLTSLHLGRVLDFPLEVFYLCSALQDLKIRNTTFLHPIAGAYGGLGLNQPRPRLKSLYIGVQNAARDIEILNWFCQPQCAFDLSEFISFHCVDHTEEIETHELVKRFVQLVSPTIQDLTMQLPAERSFSPCFSDYFSADMRRTRRCCLDFSCIA